MRVVRCDYCEYVWTYKGELLRATCPNCGRKTWVGPIGRYVE